MNKKFTLIISILLNIVALFSISNLRMEGYFDAQFGRTLDNDQFEWNMWDPSIYLETKLFSNPFPNSDIYFKFYSSKAWKNDKLYENQLAVFSEGHIGFRQEKNGYGFSSKFFMRESGDYWTDSSLLGIIDTDSVKNDDNGQGMRFDMWHPHNGSMTYVIADFSQGSGDDIHLFRYRQSLLNEKIRTGLFFQRKHYPTGLRDDYNQVLASDLKIQTGKYFISGEIAFSWTPAEQDVQNMNEEYYENWKEFHKSNIASQLEFSGFRIGSSKWGNWFINPGAFIFGDTYRNYMGDEDKISNRVGYYFNTYYLIPQKAVTLTLNYSGYQKIVADSITVFDGSELKINEIYDPSTTLYGEVYIEFVNGFKGKISFTKKDEKWQGKEYKHYDFFSELTVENKLAKLLTQFKLKDMGEFYEKQLAGIEISVNLSDKWKIFTRGLIANDRVGSRHSIFGEIQYRLSGNTELFLQYGPSWWGSDGLVNDDEFESGGDMKEEVKLILKGWF